MVQKLNAKNYQSYKFIFIFIIFFYQIQAVSSACNPSNCPPLRGLCSNNYCVCEEGFATVNNKYIRNNGIFCNYILKSRYIAFILEFFFPFGAGHFYSGKTTLAFIKLGLFVILILSFFGLLCMIVKYRISTNAGSITLTFFTLLSLLILILMEIFDLVAYATGIYSDGNGVELS